jgi:hypothetical protein
MKKAPAVFFALFFFGRLAAFPQSSVLKRGQYGLGLSGAFATNSGAAGFTGMAGVGLGGIFDLSFSAGHAKYKPGASEFSDLKTTSYGPELQAHVIKQNSSRAPVSLAISIGYARDHFSSPDLDTEQLRMWANTFYVGATVYRDIRLSRSAYLQPSAGVTYVNTSFKVSDAAGLTLSNEDNMAAFSFSLPLVYRLSELTMLVVQPGLTFDKDTTTFAVSVGLVRALKRPSL